MEMFKNSLKGDPELVRSLIIREDMTSLPSALISCE